jgi:hypothetical protein
LRVQKILGLGLLLIMIAGLSLGAVQINQSVAALTNCGLSCIDIRQAIIGFDFKEFTVPQGLTIVLLFVFRNPTPLSAFVVDLPFKVEVAGVLMGQTTLCCLPLLVPGNGATEATGILNVPFTQIPPLAANAFKEYQKGGTLQYSIQGTATLRAVILGVIVPLIPGVAVNFQKEGDYNVLNLLIP